MAGGFPSPGHCAAMEADQSRRPPRCVPHANVVDSSNYLTRWRRETLSRELDSCDRQVGALSLVSLDVAIFLKKISTPAHTL